MRPPARVRLEVPREQRGDAVVIREIGRDQPPALCAVSTMSGGQRRSRYRRRIQAASARGETPPSSSSVAAATGIGQTVVYRDTCLWIAAAPTLADDEIPCQPFDEVASVTNGATKKVVCLHVSSLDGAPAGTMPSQPARSPSR
jgi:hypothetical protein